MQHIESEYKGKKVFLTGHTGYKGSWLIYCLRQMGAEVLGYSLEPEDHSLYLKIQGDALCDSQIADILDFSALKKTLAEFQPDYVFHLAAQSLVRESYRYPQDTFNINIIGTVNLLEAVKSVNSQCTVIVVTTDKVYENMEWIHPYRESDQLGGHDPYSSSKACAEIVSESYRNSFFNPSCYVEHQTAVATARAGNVIGGGDWNKDHLVPDIINALSQDGVVQIRSPQAVRPWQHVLEPIFGYLQLGIALKNQPQQFSSAWNFGPELADNVTVESFVQRVIRIWGQGRYKAAPENADLHEATLLRLDISKAASLLHWKPLFTVDQAIKYTVEWYRDYLQDPATVMDLMARDLQHYLSALEDQDRLNAG